jgi:hypothetical protein
MTTRDRVGLMRIVLSRLVAHRRDDEEIIVVDGGSTDGTVELLSDLLRRGEIQQFSSQPDTGEAHGLNRGILMARGRLIKPVSDDDAYHWEGIEACKQFMLSHDEIDVVGANGGGNDWHSPGDFQPFEYEDAFLRWREDHSCFAFCGLGLMIRRTSLPLVGLFNPAFVRVDMEYSLRITQGRCGLAWHLDSDYLRIAHDQSNGIAQSAQLDDEAVYMAVHEGTQGVRPNVQALRTGKSHDSRLRSVARRLRSSILPVAAETSPISAVLTTSNGPDEWHKVLVKAEAWLAERNRQTRGFLC